jgi:exo-beta-1,3-glucanase (GH17 family)
MTVQPGNTSRLNVVKGCSQLLEVDSSDTSLLDKVLPANILLRDSTTGGLYLTDGLHDLSYIFANNELLSDSEMTAEAVTTIANQILYANNE